MRRLLLPLLTICLAAGAHDARPLPFFYDLYTFRGDGGRTDVVAAFAVPAGGLEVERVGPRVRYRFDVSLVLTDTARDVVLRTDDSVYVELRSRPDGSHLLFTHMQVEADPSTSTVHRVIMSDATSPGIGQLYTDGFEVRDYRGDTLMLSDVALGQPEPTGGWQRGDVTIALLPTSQFPGSTFDVFYEVYNLPAGRPYRTEIAVERVDERGDPLRAGRASVRFRGNAQPDARGTVRELRRVQTSLERGKHRLTVTVTDVQTGESAARSTLFTVRGRGRATMVPAFRR